MKGLYTLRCIFWKERNSLIIMHNKKRLQLGYINNVKREIINGKMKKVEGKNKRDR